MNKLLLINSSVAVTNYTHILKANINRDVLYYDSTDPSTSLIPDYVLDKNGRQFKVVKLQLESGEGDRLTISLQSSNTIMQLYFGFPKSDYWPSAYKAFNISSASNNVYNYVDYGPSNILSVFGNSMNEPSKIWLSVDIPPFA